MQRQKQIFLGYFECDSCTEFPGNSSVLDPAQKKELKVNSLLRFEHLVTCPVFLEGFGPLHGQNIILYAKYYFMRKALITRNVPYEIVSMEIQTEDRLIPILCVFITTVTSFNLNVDGKVNVTCEWTFKERLYCTYGSWCLYQVLKSHTFFTQNILQVIPHV